MKSRPQRINRRCLPTPVLALLILFVGASCGMKGRPVWAEPIPSDEKIEDNPVELELRIDLSGIDSSEWQAALQAMAKRHKSMRAGHRDVTLLRVLFEGEDAVEISQPRVPPPSSVNDVMLFHSGLKPIVEPASVSLQAPLFGPTRSVQLTSVKLNGFDSYPGGGGNTFNAQHGSFVIVEHVNSGSRKDNRDPVRLHSWSGSDKTIWIDVPPKGELGILGDVVIKLSPGARWNHPSWTNDANIMKMPPSAYDPRLDLSDLDSDEWQAAIKEATDDKKLITVHSRYSLVRVVFREHPEGTPQSESREPLSVNGVRLFIPGATPQLRKRLIAVSQSHVDSETETTATLMGTKLLPFRDHIGGGGMYRTVRHGDFVLYDHSNPSSSRMGGRDPLDVGSIDYGNTKIWVPVPPRGELGILGDIVLTRTPDTRLGRIIAEIVGPSEEMGDLGVLQVGSKAVGGTYGRSYGFSSQGLAASDRISPGTYKIVLPAFDVVKSRWNVDVHPGQTTFLRFEIDKDGKVELVGRKTITFSSDEGSVSTR